MAQDSKLEDAVAGFLGEKRIAVAGVSRSGNAAANLIYRKLRTAGHEVFAVNPHAAEIEGDRCYPDLASIEGGVGAVVIATHPRMADTMVEECARLGIKRVWMHRSFGPGSVSETAVSLCRERGISVIPGACPMMFVKPVDLGHRCMRWVLGALGKLPEPSG